MKSVMYIKWMFLMFFSLAFTSVQADEINPISISMTVKEEVKELNNQGKESIQYIEPTHIVPGDTVMYTTEYSNHHQKTINHVVITNPIPKHLIYIQGSAEQRGVPLTFSINHGETFAAADKLVVTDQKGRVRPATVADYTHLRWKVASVLPKEKGTLFFRAKVK
ncbi:hypothetical protein MNBD_GAMMA04-1184 [hydrothermal vent metagenome]|uniref:DUF11 domain-containing protein n=1 Tax=hydrothermal vent metagenome TaxID=652676 RepID=A0A3B0WCX2_9ZZZZ